MTEAVINTPQNPVTTQSIDANGDVVTDSSGNPAVKVVAEVNNQYFTPSSYTGKITTVEDGTTFAIATGATKLLLQSLEYTLASEFAVLAFGETAADAQTNLGKTGTTPNIISTQGTIIRSGETGGTSGVQPPDVIVDIPANARDGGYAALGHGVAGLVQIVMVTQGI